MNLQNFYRNILLHDNKLNVSINARKLEYWCIFVFTVMKTISFTFCFIMGYVFTCISASCAVPIVLAKVLHTCCNSSHSVH